jgi:3-dehydroshikimate dehydratase
MRAGLASVTFRQLTVPEIIDLAKQCHLDGIEWGGDVHVPVGELKRAEEVANLTRRAGLNIASYGSYYSARDTQDFEAIVKTAKTLRAPSIRVWAGSLGSDEAKEQDRVNVVSSLRLACNLAAALDLRVSAEYHPHTLCDSCESALRLRQEVDRLNFDLYWQPDPELSHQKRCEDLRSITPYLSNIHVFQWTRPNDRQVRHPLTEGESEWLDYLKIASGCRYAILEFTKDDSPESLCEDALTLHRLLSLKP